MSTVVMICTPGAVSTICNICFCSIALNVVQHGLSSTRVATASEPSTVSVYNHKSFCLAYIVRLYDTDFTVSILGLGFAMNDFLSVIREYD